MVKAYHIWAVPWILAARSSFWRTFKANQYLCEHWPLNYIFNFVPDRHVHLAYFKHNQLSIKLLSWHRWMNEKYAIYSAFRHRSPHVFRYCVCTWGCAISSTGIIKGREYYAQVRMKHARQKAATASFPQWEWVNPPLFSSIIVYVLDVAFECF